MREAGIWKAKKAQQELFINQRDPLAMVRHSTEEFYVDVYNEKRTQSNNNYDCCVNEKMSK